MKKTAFAVMLTACVVLTSGIYSAQGQVKGQQQGGKNFKTIAYVKIEEGRNKIYVTVLQLKSDKIAAVAKLPKKSHLKIEAMSLKSPSGNKYKAKSIRNMRSREVEKYLQSAYLKRGFSGPAFCNIGSFFAQEAEANCGHCEGGSGSTSTSTSTPSTQRDDSPGAGIGMGILIDTATSDNDPWVSVGVFDTGGDSSAGAWGIGVGYSDAGLNANGESWFNWANPGWSDPAYTEPTNIMEQWTEFRALCELFGGGPPVKYANPPPEFDGFWHAVLPYPGYPGPPDTPAAPAPPADFDTGSLLGE